MYPLARLLLQMEKVGSGASKVVYKAFDEEEGLEVAWNEVFIPDCDLFRCVSPGGQPQLRAATDLQK